MDWTEDERRILAERAQRLAHAGEDEGAAAETSAENQTLLVFRAGAARYALPLAAVVEVVRNPKLAPVPGAPPSVAGLIQIRGNILPVFRVREDSPERETSAAIVVRHGDRTAALLAGEIEGTRTVSSTLERPTGADAHVAALTGDAVAVLDLDAVLGKG